MKMEITFRHMEHTESIDERIREKLQKFGQKHFSQDAVVAWTCLVEHGEHKASVNVRDRGHDFHAKASSGSMYKTIDQVITKLESQILSQGHQSSHP